MSMREIGDSVRRVASDAPFLDVDAARQRFRDALVPLEGVETPELDIARVSLGRAYEALGSAAVRLGDTVDGANDYLAHINQPGIAGPPGWQNVQRHANRLTGRSPATKALGHGRLTSRTLESWVVDEIDRQYEDGIRPKAEFSVLEKLAEPHPLRQYEDAEPYRIGKDFTPASIMVKTLDDFRRLVDAAANVANGNFKGIDDMVLHEREHVQLMDALVEMFGSREGGIGEINIGFELKVMGRPRWAGFGRKRIIPLVLQPFTSLSNLTVPAIAVPLASAIPRVLSEGDKAAIAAKGRKNKQEVLRRVALYNQRPGVRPLPLPRNQ